MLLVIQCTFWQVMLIQCITFTKSSNGNSMHFLASNSNRGVSHYRILPVSRDIGWPVQQLDYFRYIKQHILTIELLYIGYNFKEIKNGN